MVNGGMVSVTSSSKFVSVIMAAYNAEKTIVDAVQSILGQTYKDFELIICDDASTDNTWYLLESLAGKDSRIRLIRQEKNRGSAVARNMRTFSMKTARSMHRSLKVRFTQTQICAA